MKLKDWLDNNGMSLCALAKICKISPATVKNIVEGKPVRFRTVKRIVRFTKDMKPPVSATMFERIIGKKRGTPF
jgi:predicted transcriptional regulator